MIRTLTIQSDVWDNEYLLDLLGMGTEKDITTIPIFRIAYEFEWECGRAYKSDAVCAVNVKDLRIFTSGYADV